MAVSGVQTTVGPNPLAAGGAVRAPAEIFNQIFIVFLGLGTLVGVVVITYTLYNAYKYRYREEQDPDPDVDRPEVGEIPEGGGKGKKLFLSFGMSAIIVLSLIAWTYGALVTIENKPQQLEQQGQDVLDIDVVGQQFVWRFIYPNGHETSTLRVPADRVVQLSVTSTDVMHNFGIPSMRVKADAIPGQTTTTWFVAEQPGRHMSHCYELCGEFHSTMDAQVIVMEPAAYQEWYNGTSGAGDNSSATGASSQNGTAASVGSHAEVTP